MKENIEEEKAIKYYQNKDISFSVDFDTKKLLEALGITEEDSFENHQIRFKTLLNLIEKLQKENEELKIKTERKKIKDLECHCGECDDEIYRICEKYCNYQDDEVTLCERERFANMNVEDYEKIEETLRIEKSAEDIIEKLQKENEELKYKYDKALSDLVKVEKESKTFKSFTSAIFNDEIEKELIPVQKIKDKIEELKERPLTINENNKYYYETDAYNKIIIQVLQDLLEEKGE